MAAVFTWSVRNWSFNPASGLVSRLYWQLAGADGEIADTRIGYVNLPAGEVAVPLAEITRELALGWLAAALGPEFMAAAEAQMAAAIAARLAPVQVTALPPGLKRSAPSRPARKGCSGTATIRPRSARSCPAK